MGTSKKKAKCQIRFFSQKINVGSHVTEALGVQVHCVEPGFLGLCPSHEPVESPLTQRWVTTFPGGSAHPPLPLLRDHRQRTWVLRASPAPPGSLMEGKATCREGLVQMRAGLPSRGSLHTRAAMHASGSRFVSWRFGAERRL